MRIIVSEIPPEGFDIESEEPVESEWAVDSAKLSLRVEKVDTEVTLRGVIAARLKLLCSRCLSDFTRDISIPVDLSYHPVDEILVEEKHELAPAELNTGFYRNDEVDLQEISTEQVLLNVPMKPLCSETCKGICPMCGANRNEGACGCDLERTDRKLGKLEEYLKERKG